MNDYIISSWRDSSGKELSEGDKIEYELDLFNAFFPVERRPVKLYGTIVKSKYGWYGVLPVGFPADERPNPLWSLQNIKICQPEESFAQ
jgi:hypothetical protein